MASPVISTKTNNQVLSPPEEVRGMKTLNRDAFSKDISVPCVLVPLERMQDVSKLAKPFFLKLPKFSPVQDEGGKKKVFLHPNSLAENSAKVAKVLTLAGMEEVLETEVTLRYENWTCDQVFRAVLPAESTGNVASFSVVGHIIHLNLKPDLEDFKRLIGQVLLDKHANARTVVNKAQIIENEFRNLSIELLAGEPDYEVAVRENGCQYAFDFSKVFWNPRLVHEHAEIVRKVGAHDAVFDVFAGVGPFAVPLAKKRCEVHANDLNPDSYRWLCHNARLNKVSGNLTCHNMDGRRFIREVVREGLVRFWNGEEGEEGVRRQFHVLMNLPACALEFLEEFQDLFGGGEQPAKVGTLPRVHCHFFKKKDEDVRGIMSRYFDEDTLDVLEFADVRLVAPNKMMMRVSYQVPRHVLFSDDSVERPRKKLKCDNGVS